MDVDQAMRAIRLAKLSDRALTGKQKLRKALDRHAAGTTVILDVADTARRIRDKNVTKNDVHFLARMGFRGLVYVGKRRLRKVRQ